MNHVLIQWEAFSKMTSSPWPLTFTHLSFRFCPHSAHYCSKLTDIHHFWYLLTSCVQNVQVLPRNEESNLRQADHKYMRYPISVSLPSYGKAGQKWGALMGSFLLIKYLVVEVRNLKKMTFWDQVSYHYNSYCQLTFIMFIDGIMIVHQSKALQNVNNVDIIIFPQLINIISYRPGKQILDIPYWEPQSTCSVYILFIILLPFSRKSVMHTLNTTDTQLATEKTFKLRQVIQFKFPINHTCNSV